MSGWLKWLPWLRKPVFVTGPPPVVMSAPIAPAFPFGGEFDECDCGRAHPRGYVCCSNFRDQL